MNLQSENLSDSLLSESQIQSKRTLFQKISLSYCWPTLKLSTVKALEFDDISDLDFNQRSHIVHEKFIQVFRTLPQSKYSLIKALIKCFKIEIIFTFGYLLIMLITQVIQPVMIKYLLDYVDSDRQNLQDAVIYVSIISISKFVNILAAAQSRLIIRSVGYEAQTAISVELLSKSLRVSFLSNQQHTSGEVINLMQVDAGKLQLTTYYLGVALLVPIQVGFSIYLMFSFIGISFLSGFGVIIISGILNSLLGKLLIKQQNSVMKSKDVRTKCANQIFSQIKFIKINVLEEYFKEKLFKLRNIELRNLKMRYISQAVLIFSVWLCPQLILCATFGTIVWLGNDLTPSSTFAIIGLFQMLQDPLNQLPMAINELLSTNVSLQRIKKYFYTSEVMDDIIKHPYEVEYAVQIKNGNFFWVPKQQEQKIEKSDQIQKIEKTQIVDSDQEKIKIVDSEEKIQVADSEEKIQVVDSEEKIQVAVSEQQNTSYVLKNIDLTIPNGKLTMFIGDVGSGKSSLIQSMIGEMLYDKEKQPEISIYGRVAYVSQKAWIQNATVKDNIIFGNYYDEQKYNLVLKYACLKEDLKILINGDATMIGEKGINLSGGQKARISLARAIYSDADIFLLDDPISAVDAHVGNSIMCDCLNGYLKRKTIILITHALNNCKFADYIYLMDNGQIIEQGNFNEIRESQQFKKIYEKFHKQTEDEDAEIEQPLELIKKQSLIKEQSTNQNQEEDKLIMDEDRSRGSIPLATYRKYYHYNGSHLFFILLILIQLSWLGCYIGNSFWIAHWSEQDNVDGGFYLEIYFYFSLGQGLFAFFRVLIIVLQNMASANKIHTKMINALMKAPLCQYFERVPLGRILNRLTKDQNVLDSEIFWGISWTSISFSGLVSNIIILIYTTTYYITIPIVLYFIGCLLIQRFYMATTRELQRLESISKSPILSYFQESIQGLSIIRVFEKQKVFLEKHCTNLDLNRKIFLEQIVTNCWFIMILGLMSLVVNISATTYCIFFADIAPSLAGLLLTYGSMLDTNVSGVIQALGIFETGLVSFERCLNFTEVEPESGLKIKTEISNWPQQGEIQYDDYSVKYREGLKPALNSLTLTIQPNSKIGVVGRTGAGKSTITLTLLRILEGFSGKLMIDGVDISQLSLSQVRQSITMIMQDATIFDGSLRQNIDPLQRCSDEEIINALKQCCLDNLLQKRGLDSEISEGGENLSSGERQLICIARAILKKTKIVLIDEATANIDIDTEHIIQETIQKAFQDCTVITIAHRINTILHCDKILVIDQGKLIEFGNTNDLLQNKQSKFYDIYQEALNNQRKK